MCLQVSKLETLCKVKKWNGSRHLHMVYIKIKLQKDLFKFYLTLLMLFYLTLVFLLSVEEKSLCQSYIWTISGSPRCSFFSQYAMKNNKIKSLTFLHLLPFDLIEYNCNKDLYHTKIGTETDKSMNSLLMW